MERFAIRPEIWFGPGALGALERLAGKRVLLVTDGFLSSSGLAKRAAERLTGPVEIFDKVEPDPSLKLVAEGVAALEGFGPDAVVAFGGGSPMDCAKAMCWFSKGRPPLWCIPTTAGTGSEVTAFAVLTDTERGVKYPLVEEGLLPETAILDPSLLEGVPPKVTADTGMDVLTHAAEAYVAKGSSPFSDALAEKAFALAYERLPAAFVGDLGAKGDMLLCSCMAGMAFNAAGLGVCHAMAHALGGRYHVPHGRLNAVLLPAVVACNAQTAGERYTALARQAGLGGSAETVALRNLKNGLIRLRRELRLPATLAEAGIAPRDLRRNLGIIVEAALADPCCRTNPVEPTRGMLEELLTEVAGRG